MRPELSAPLHYLSLTSSWLSIEIQKNLNNVRNDVKQVLQTQHTQLEETMLQWLTPVEYTSQQHEYFFRRRHPGTGQWLLDAPEFQAWLSATSYTLYCHGIPGAGKTILASVVVDHLCRRYGTDLSVLVAYVYCNFQQRGQQGTQNIEDLLASLTKQLARSHASFPTPIRDLYDTYTKRGTRPSQTDLTMLLHSMISLSSKTFVVLDALDELSNTCRSKLLAEIFKIQAVNPLNIFLTARPSLDVEQELRECALYKSLEIYARDEDVEVYLEDRISELKVSITADFWREIKDAISKAANGM